MPSTGNLENRRPLATRERGWARALAARLSQASVRPNAISVLSCLFAALAGACLVASGRAPSPWAVALPLGAAAFIQLRLLCNLLDGLVAVEGGHRTKSGEIFNDLPDRISDTLILLGAGYAQPGHAWAAVAGWAAALLALLTAYVRVLGVSAGTRAHFSGPMAKQHRMALLTAACIGAAVEAAAGARWSVLAWALGVIALGSLLTAARRTLRIVRELESA